MITIHMWKRGERKCWVRMDKFMQISNDWQGKYELCMHDNDEDEDGDMKILRINCNTFPFNTLRANKTLKYSIKIITIDIETLSHCKLTHSSAKCSLYYLKWKLYHLPDLPEFQEMIFFFDFIVV